MAVLHALDRATALAHVAAAPGGLRAMRRVRPFSIAAFVLVKGLAAEGLAFATVVDVGANVGQFSRAALARWPDASVIAFEPLPEAADTLRHSLAGFPGVEVHAIAVGDQDAAVTFHPHTYSLSSSALPMLDEARERYHWAEERPPIEVAERRLDSVLGDRRLAGPTLLKLDVQGYELKVLAGAGAVLDQVDAIVLEQSFERFYQGQPLFTETNRFLESTGWRLARPLGWRREEGRVVEVDCLYLRES
jgi:FkbM family methyltransferase